MAEGTISLKSSGAMRGQIIWWSDTDVGSNTSTVTAVLQVRKGSEYSGTTGTFSGYLEVGSGSASDSYYGEVASDWVDVVRYSQTISHDSEGKATCYLYGEIKGPSGTSLAGVTVSGSATVTLDTIPRASSFTVSGTALGSAVKFTVTRKSTSYSHAITYQCGTASGTAVSKTTTESLSWTPPLSLAEQNTKGATVSVKFTLTTYNGSTKIASTSKTVSLTIPDSVAPTVSVAVEDSTTCYADYGAYVQSKSALKITLTAEGIYGSTIASQQAKFDDKTYLGASSTTDAIKGSGTMQLVATVKDSRGKTASVTVEIDVLAYTPPQISALSVTRCNADGEKNAAGGYLIVEFDASVTALNQKNSAAYTIQYKKSTESAYTDVALEDLAGNYSVQGYAYIFAASKSTSHTVVLSVEDDFGTVTRNAVGPSEVTLWSKLAKGMGFAFGKVAERVSYLDMGWPIHMNGNRLHGLPEPEDDDDASTKAFALLAAYPVGAVYISFSATSPASLFGGTWEKIEGRFLLAASSKYSAGSEGGEAKHKLTVKEIPSHTHDFYCGPVDTPAATGSGELWPPSYSSNQTNSALIASAGGDQPHNNMPPYVAVYMWQRVE